MNKPLSIVNTPTLIQKQKLNIISVSQVLSQFNMKSPKHKPITLTERSPSASKSLCSPKNNKIVQIKLPKCQNHLNKTTHFNEEKNSARKSEVREQSSKKNIHEISIQKIRELPKIQSHKSITINLPGEKGKERINSAKKQQDFRKRTVNKLMKQITQIDVKKQKQNSSKIPSLQLKQKTKKTRPQPLSERQSNQPLTTSKISTSRSIKSIKIDPKIKDIATCKHQEEQNFFRKGSSVSTMSLKSKHVLSMQFFDDYQELFSKQPTRMSQKSEKSEKSEKEGPVSNPMSALQEVKSKIYSQIDSLDKKLLTNQIKSESTKHLKICLKKKNTAKMELAPLETS